ncbi:MAG: hypothetical protein M1833_005788 [Piccolia ochrophora]|nr:MAG: hypothetical protein M1833_005788 [Piccolia ochrophora]
MTNRPSSTAPSDFEADDARAEAAALIGDLRSQLQRAEVASEEYQRQLQGLQSRLDDALADHGKVEERLHEHEERIEEMKSEKRDLSRQQREMENIYEAERVSMMQEKEEMATQEEELHSVIQRLKEGLAQRDLRANHDDGSRTSRTPNNSSPSLENGYFAPPSSLQRSDSRTNSKVLLQKDRVIESLRLELAEAQIKLVESENMGGGRVQDLEKVLLETRMTNAKLMEDNESFQLLLSEKTLNGDFSRADFMQASTSSALSEDTTTTNDTMSSSLADELESATEADGDKVRKLEMENKAAKDANKALTLYINNIIERLLQHSEFETILDKTPNLMAGPNAASIVQGHSNTDKELPPPPPKDDDAAPSLLQRAKSVALGGANPRTTRPRPMSQMPPPSKPTHPPSETILSGSSLSRSQSTRLHRRSTSEWSPPPTTSIVNHMYRGPPPGSGGPATSPSSLARQGSYFTPASRPGNPNAAARAPSNDAPRPFSSSNSSDYSGDDRDAVPPAPAPAPAPTAAPIAGNKLRPLRLVQENRELGSGDQGGRKVSDPDDADAKRAKRGSWMGWFNKGKAEEGPIGGFGA